MDSGLSRWVAIGIKNRLILRLLSCHFLYRLLLFTTGHMREMRLQLDSLVCVGALCQPFSPDWWEFCLGRKTRWMSAPPALFTTKAALRRREEFVRQLVLNNFTSSPSPLIVHFTTVTWWLYNITYYVMCFAVFSQLHDWRRFGSVHATPQPPAGQHGRRQGDTPSKHVVWTRRRWQVNLKHLKGTFHALFPVCLYYF